VKSSISAAPERFSLDTNVLIYAVDTAELERHRRAAWVVERAQSLSCILAVQSLGEYYAAVTRKSLLSRSEAALMVRSWMAMFPVVSNDADAVTLALPAVETGRFSYWDALLLGTLARAGCTTLLSEDMADGSSLAGVTVRNPFAGDVVPESVARLLGG
jgi:predicted nucleic acid-binding protein